MALQIKQRPDIATSPAWNSEKTRIPFRSLIVHEDFEGALSTKDQTRITNVADKQFTSLADFTQNAEEYLARETELVQ